MMLRTGAFELDGGVPQRRVADFTALAKPRVVAMVLLTTGVGFYVGSAGACDVVRLLKTLLGTGLAAAGTLALNQYLERDVDAKMERTRQRPLPEGRLRPSDALFFGVALICTGVLCLTFAVNGLSGLVVAVTAGSYLLVYTPMKRVTPLCSVVGAIPGALPPVAGSVAAHNGVGIDTWVLFAILFLWQLPHALAIACVYRDDYARGGVRVSPVVAPDCRGTARQIVMASALLLIVAALPSVVGMAGAGYLVGALALGALLLGYSAAFALQRAEAAAQRLVVVSLVYLPTLLLMLVFDRTPR